MNDTDYGTPSYEAGCMTPPLSPTKTVSTEGWSSPRTPQSPRKTRSCLFIRDIDNGPGSPYLNTPSSPTRSKAIARFGALSVPELPPASHDLGPLGSDNDSPIKLDAPQGVDRPSSCRFPTLTRMHILLSPDNGNACGGKALSLSDGANIFDSGTPPTKGRKPYCSLSETSVCELKSISLPTLSPSDTVITDMETSVPPSPDGTNLCVEEKPPALKLHRLYLRSASSPLRPNQWLPQRSIPSTPRQSQTSTPDRFIACRRPSAVTRESFELNKPAERLETERKAGRGSRSGADVFSRRLRRSGRLNDELRGLREAHSSILERSGANRGNANFRRSSHPFSVRQISAGAVWNVGGPSAVSDTVAGVSTVQGSILGRGTNAPLYKSSFLNRADPEAELEAYERRLALALSVDQTDRILQHSPLQCTAYRKQHGGTTLNAKHVWRDGAWVEDLPSSPPRRLQEALRRRPVPILPFRYVYMIASHASTLTYPTVLDAPQLRDDYYCTLLAYSHTAKCLAVGLGNYVHLWSERSGVATPGSLNSVPPDGATNILHVASLDFSSTQGGQAILAVGRADGRVSLWSPFDPEPRFDATQPKPVSSVSWRPTTVQRPSLRDRAMDVHTEELLIRDEVGHIYFYSVEWPSETQSALFGWHGAMTLLARLTIHTQQICGLAWSLDGELFASGGNDNNCFLFETRKVLRPDNNSESTSATMDIREGPSGESIYTVTNRSGPVIHLSHTAAKQKWTLNAAVKAMAFCPWQRGLIAIGGGSNDRCIHFYHTRSGTCLASIDCAAQVTGLIWSQTRREIAATFGFAQPDHPYRVAVFSWPSCEQVIAVPWWDESRALCAIAYPGGPTSSLQVQDGRDGRRARGEDGVWSRRGIEEGCIVIAASDMAIRFHEIWSDRRGSVGSGSLLGSGAAGLLGGSSIFEGLHDVARWGTVIR